MQGKIALEEHFAIGETLNDSRGYFPDWTWQELKSRILDIQERRLREMDENGIELMLLSLNAPAVQSILDPAQADDIARQANDYLAEEVRKRPDRFQGLAALAMQDPERAARELERCVKELGFRGALVNGFSQVNDPETTVYYDLPQYRPFWATAERLDVPFYLHPRNPLPRDAKIYEGHSWLLGPTWAFGQETAVHALRLMGSGLFDAYPALQIILGHMGENLPFGMWRVDNTNGWIENRHNYPAKKRISEYFCANFHITTSGNFHTQALIDSMLVLGADRIMFSTDWPFENIDHAARWFDVCPIGENDRLKIGRTNAMKLFKLSRG
jgi:predicted TIM-barrel fold metal-dependent hydrolase